MLWLNEDVKKDKEIINMIADDFVATVPDFVQV